MVGFIPCGECGVRSVFVDTVGLGILLWFIGWLGSILLYFFLPPEFLGWVLFILFTPVMIAISVLWFGRKTLSLRYYVVIALFWTFIAIIFDYFFIVKLFNPEDYYHTSVIMYYLETFLIPLITGLWYQKKA